MVTKKAIWIFVGGLMAVAFLVLFSVFNPLEYSFFPSCPFHSLTGLHCPGCGSQRAIHLLLHGEFWQAFQMNALLLLTLPILLYALGLRIYNYVKDTKHRVSIFYKNSFVKAFAILVVLFWVARNLPFDPFIYLAPNI
ncbi:DUF2752 domain-containing protein [Luteirhabdus pelagi]|uniref:DUF2752 domain-containing protein n=1 Tax=Luteirhabdus pelagi TaxID=2792783 RepID=UPI0019399F5D|nr:DUF2752 domain-containing protein [Luteirhabdus pelagi]